MQSWVSVCGPEARCLRPGVPTLGLEPTYCAAQLGWSAQLACRWQVQVVGLVPSRVPSSSCLHACVSHMDYTLCLSTRCVHADGHTACSFLQHWADVYRAVLAARSGNGDGGLGPAKVTWTPPAAPVAAPAAAPAVDTARSSSSGSRGSTCYCAPGQRTQPVQQPAVPTPAAVAASSGAGSAGTRVPRALQLQQVRSSRMHSHAMTTPLHATAPLHPT